MPDNPFENKAKQKLDELKFTPSDAVWQKVEGRIKKDKDRRRLLVWLPLFCLLLCAGGWYFISVNSKPHPSKETAALSNDEKTATDSFSVHPAPSKSQILVPVEKNKAERDLNSLKTPRLSSDGFSRHPSLKMTDQQKRKAVLSLTQKEKRGPSGLPVQTEIKLNAANGNNQSRLPDESATENKLHDTDSASAESRHRDISKDNTLAFRKPDSGIQAKQPITATINKDSLKISTGKKMASGKKNKLQWAITAGPGISSISTKLIHNNSNIYNAPSAAPPGGPVYPPSLPANEQSSSYFVGLQLRKPLNKTVTLSAGIDYAYSGTRTTTGNQVNQSLVVYGSNYSLTNISSYYSAPGVTNHNYSSHYHFLEIPLGIEKQLGQNSRFSLNAGVSFAWMISTNALQYDPLSRIYFKDDSYFRKTQWNILGGIQYSLLKKEKYTLKIGPKVQYGLTGLLNKRSPYSEHLFFGGLQLLLTSNRK